MTSYLLNERTALLSSPKKFYQLRYASIHYFMICINTRLNWNQARNYNDNENSPLTAYDVFGKSMLSKNLGKMVDRKESLRSVYWKRDKNLS
jgi:hypothetical protein